MKKQLPDQKSKSFKGRTEAELKALYLHAEAEFRRPRTEAEKAELEEDFKLLGLQRLPLSKK